MADFRMPSLGADMDEGTLVEWLVKPGDQIHKGDVIAVVDTAKAAIEVESFSTGTIEKLIVAQGEVVPVGTVLATIDEHVAGEAAPKARRKPRPKAKSVPPAGQVHTGSPLVRHLAEELGLELEQVHGTGLAGSITRADVDRTRAERAGTVRPPSKQRTPRASPSTGTRQHVTPYARRTAAELSVDLAAVAGTGPAGAVRAADVRLAAEAQRAAARPPVPAATAMSAAARVRATRQVTARLMARSKREIPHYYLSDAVDLSRAMAWLHDRNRELEVTERLVPAALLLKAAAVAAARVPQLNGFWIDDQFVAADGVHLGVAISLRGGGLVTPAIHDAADLSPLDLMIRLRDLVSRARTGRLRGSELTDATITVTNLGDQGVEMVYGVIYPPQVALVGFGKVTERAVAVDGLVGAHPVVMTTLAADHRATDGYTGARFLTALSDLLQRPEDM